MRSRKVQIILFVVMMLVNDCQLDVVVRSYMLLTEMIRIEARMFYKGLFLRFSVEKNGRYLWCEEE